MGGVSAKAIPSPDVHHYAPRRRGSRSRHAQQSAHRPVVLRVVLKPHDPADGSLSRTRNQWHKHADDQTVERDGRTFDSRVGPLAEQQGAPEVFGHVGRIFERARMC